MSQNSHFHSNFVLPGLISVGFGIRVGVGRWALVLVLVLMLIVDFGFDSGFSDSVAT